MNLDHILLVLFRAAEPSDGMRTFFRDSGSFEIGAGAWLVPLAAEPEVCLRKIRQHDPFQCHGIVVASLARCTPPIALHDFPELAEWLKNARKPLGE